MKPKRGVLGGTAAVALILGACVPDNSVQKGAPVLTSVLVSDPSAGNVTGTRAIVAVDGSVDPVEPLLVPLYLVFDRLLDASTLEDVVYDPATGQVSQDGGLVSRPGIVNVVAASQGVL